MTLVGKAQRPMETVANCDVALVSARTHVLRAVTSVLEDCQTYVSRYEAMSVFLSNSPMPDVIVVDAGPDGREAPRASTLMHLRGRWPTATVCVLGVGTEADVIRLLDEGVDEAMGVTMEWRHVAACLRATVRRARTVNAALRRSLGDVIHDRDNRRVWCAGEEVALSPTEWRLFDFLWRHAERVATHAALQECLWPSDEAAISTSRLDVCVSRVRFKLRRSTIVGICTLRGVGYRLGRLERGS